MGKSFFLGFFALIKSALLKEKAIIPNDFNYELAFEFANSHNIVPLLYYGIVNSEINLSPELNNKFFEYTCKYMNVSEKQKSEFESLVKTFEENGIDFMPLKGSVIRSIYPNVSMRSMGDADILIKEEQYEKITSILEKNGFKFVKESLNELCWNKPPFYLELHRYLVSPRNKDYFNFFGSGWQYAKLSDGYNYKYEMSDEDFFVFIFAHMAKHYRNSGIGLKHVIDIWWYLKCKPQLDDTYIKGRLKDCKLLDFYKNVLKTIDVWFEGKEFDNITYLITSKIFSSGVFGTSESETLSRALKEKEISKVNNAFINRILFTIFLPYPNMCLLFPVLKKAPFLLPFLWIYRGIRTVILKKGNVMKSFNDAKQVSSEQLLKYEEDLNAVGLDFNFKE